MPYPVVCMRFRIISQIYRALASWATQPTQIMQPNLRGISKSLSVASIMEVNSMQNFKVAATNAACNQHG